MKIINLLLRQLLLYTFCFLLAQPAYSQENSILVQGKPPLTQLMVGKTIVFLDWVLDLKLNKEQEIQIQQVVENAWRNKNTAQIKSTLEVIDIYEQVVKLNETERNSVKTKLQPVLLQNLQKEPQDELSKIIASAYRSSRSGETTVEKKNSPANTTSTNKNNLRVGGDGVTGLYRMMRPKALNIISTMPESGYYIEHIVFFPDGKLYRFLPPEGLMYFDYALACRTHPADCGTYEMNNGEIYVYLGPEKKKYIFTRSGEKINNAPELGKGSFRSIPTADGLKLEGKYRRYETEPTITFTKDGRFTDGGAFKNFGTIGRLDGSSYMDDGMGGSGTYLIEQNTLELKYSDGRIKRFVFEAFPENLEKKPAVESFLLYGQRLLKILS